MTPETLTALMIAPLPDSLLEEALAVLKPTAMQREELTRRLTEVRRAYCWQFALDAEQAGDNKAARSKVIQTARAARKLTALISDPAISTVILAAKYRRYEQGEAYARPSPTLQLAEVALLDLIEAMELALNTPASRDIRRDDAIRKLVTGMAELFTAATRKDVAHPTYNPVTGEVGGAFMRFLRAATKDVPDLQSRSDEALRRYVREAIEHGAIGKKKSGSRLCTNDAHGANRSVTGTDEVTEGEREAQRPTQRGHKRSRTGGARRASSSRDQRT